MGSFQTCWTTFRHLDLFSYAGLFSGFMRSPRTGEGAHLGVLDDAGAFHRALKVFFRAMGDKDPFFDAFRQDSEICRERTSAALKRSTTVTTCGKSGANVCATFCRCCSTDPLRPAAPGGAFCFLC